MFSSSDHESCVVQLHHACAEICRLRAEVRRLQDRLFVIDHEEIERSVSRPPRPLLWPITSVPRISWLGESVSPMRLGESVSPMRLGL